MIGYEGSFPNRDITRHMEDRRNAKNVGGGKGLVGDEAVKEGGRGRGHLLSASTTAPTPSGSLKRSPASKESTNPETVEARLRKAGYLGGGGEGGFLFELEECGEKGNSRSSFSGARKAISGIGQG